MAMRLLRFRRYDAVIADLEFDHWQCAAGLDIARAARRRGGDAIVVLLTSDDGAAPDAIQAGADFVVQKPIALDVLADLIPDITTTRDRSRCPTTPAAHRPLAPSFPI